MTINRNGTRKYGTSAPHLADVPTHFKDQALTVLLHYMSMDVRARLAIEAPAAYNAITGGDHARVVHGDGSPWSSGPQS